MPRRTNRRQSSRLEQWVLGTQFSGAGVPEGSQGTDTSSYGRHAGITEPRVRVSDNDTLSSVESFVLVDQDEPGSSSRDEWDDDDVFRVCLT